MMREAKEGSRRSSMGFFLNAVSVAKAAWTGLPVAHRVSVILYAALVGLLGAPWLEYEPFIDMRRDPQGPLVMHGFELPGRPGLVPAGLGLVGLIVLFVSEGSKRTLGGFSVFVVTFVLSVAFVVTEGLWACILCDVEALLWGAYAASGVALVGMILLGYELREGLDPAHRG